MVVGVGLHLSYQHENRRRSERALPSGRQSQLSTTLPPLACAMRSAVYNLLPSLERVGAATAMHPLPAGDLALRTAVPRIAVFQVAGSLESI